jgi:hypothetical protein
VILPRFCGESDEAVAWADATTETLLQELRGTPTDLAKLVTAVHQRHRKVVAVSPDAVLRWQTDAPDAWKRVREWLTTRGVMVIYS